MTEETQTQEQAAKIIRNNVTMPREGTKSRQVWELCDKMQAELGKVDVKQLKAQADELGVTAATASTQHARWRKFNDMVTPRPRKEKAAEEDVVVSSDEDEPVVTEDPEYDE